VLGTLLIAMAMNPCFSPHISTVRYRHFSSINVWCIGIYKVTNFLVRQRTILTERPPLVGKVSANFFADKGCYVVSVTDPYGRNLGFLDRRLYFFFQVAPQLYAQG
jgi:hypothetical protein